MPRCKKRAEDWAVGEREYAADSGKVRKLLLDLGALQVVEEKTSDPANYSRIGVEDVSSPQATGTQHRSRDAEEGVHPHRRQARGHEVRRTCALPARRRAALASPQITPDADPKRWLERAVTDIPESRVKDVAVAPASGPAYTVSREKKEQTDFTVSNVPKGRELSSPGAGNPVAGDLTTLTTG